MSVRVSPCHTGTTRTYPRAKGANVRLRLRKNSLGATEWGGAKRESHPKLVLGVDYYPLPRLLLLGSPDRSSSGFPGAGGMPPIGFGSATYSKSGSSFHGPRTSSPCDRLNNSLTVSSVGCCRTSDRPACPSHRGLSFQLTEVIQMVPAILGRSDGDSA